MWVGLSTTRVTEFAGEIFNECRRVAEIVRGLLTFARQEASVQVPTHIEEFVNEATKLMGKVLTKDHLELIVRIPPGIPQVRCQTQQMQQVLLNLLSNARNALNQKYEGYQREKRIEITAQPVEFLNQSWLRISIKDFGVGIPADDLERIFDPFYTTNLGSTGTGLGLSVSRGILEERRGRLTVASELGEWTVFNIDLRVEGDPPV